jgi:DNA recombination protein RmuC
MVFLIIAGSLVCGVLAWLVSSMRLQRKYEKQVSEIQAGHSCRLAELEGSVKVAEAMVSEKGQYIGKLESEIAGLRQELGSERQSRVEALTRLEETRKSFEEQRELIDMLKKEMTDTFNALSSAALKSSSEDFLRLASESLGKVVVDTKGKLGEHQAAMDGMIKPLFETLKRYEEQIRTMEESRHKAHGSLEEQLRTLASTHENLQKETSKLVTALRRPEVRGRWGEMQLRRVAELSGMSMHCDFTEQQSAESDKGRVRPDMIVHLPMGRDIVVDSKVSLDAYLEAVAADAEEERKAGMARHAQQVRTHMNKLGSKEYWSQFTQSPEFVVLFIPGESFLGSALEVDGSLIEDGIQKRVIIATPTTFIALLRAIAYGWRQEQITKNAREVGILGKELYERISTLGKYFAELGSAIERSISAYNRMVGSLESRVLPTVRKFRELGVTGADEIPVLDHIDQRPRTPSLLNEAPEE